MAVALAGTLASLPCGSTDAQDPQQLLLGIGEASGDASGGLMVVTFTFPRNSAILLKAVYATISGNETDVELHYVPGIIVAGSNLNFRHTLSQTNAVSNRRGFVWHPAAYLSFSEAAQQVLVSIDNAATESLAAYLVAYAWSRDVISKYSPRNLGILFT